MYQSAKIYKIQSGDDVYYGSTTQSLGQRMAKHRNQHKNGKGSSATLLFNKYGIDNCTIELVEEFPCNSIEELTKREGTYIRNNKCINKNIAGRTIKEYYVDNINKYKQYYKDNRFKLLKYQNEYNKAKRDKKEEIVATVEVDA